MHLPRYKTLILLVSLALTLTSCAYRFTNVAMQPPKGIDSIAIDPVYDTSREVISHEILWQAIQAEFARNGRIRLTSREDADALMTIHLKSASVKPSGSAVASAGTVEPGLNDGEILSNPYEYKQLRRAGFSTNTESLQYKVEVKVHNLYTRQVIFEGSYDGSGTFRSVRAASVAPPDTGYLLYDEALDARTKTVSAGIAKRIVTDFLLSKLP